MKLAIRYTILAMVATALNIGAQELTVRAYGGPFSLLASIVVGTGVGLVAKYVLDKMFIFNFRARDAAHDARTFSLYTLTGIGTTAIFWAFEFAFNAAFENKDMRYVGALIGLALGYFIKYRLDKRFVFASETA